MTCQACGAENVTCRCPGPPLGHEHRCRVCRADLDAQRRKVTVELSAADWDNVLSCISATQAEFSCSREEAAAYDVLYEKLYSQIKPETKTAEPRPGGS